MEKLKQLIEELFEMHVKRRWLKEIDIALKRYKKFNDKAFREQYIMNALIKRYNELYPKEPLQVKESKRYFMLTKAKWQFWEGWIGNHDKRIEDATCSNCGYKHPKVCRTYGSNENAQDVLDKLFKFCPSCGKLMESEHV
jgi:hypothetical protein